VEAELGKLNVMSALKPGDFAQLRTGVALFSPRTSFHVGAPGAGHVIKLLNNFIAQAICTATAERLPSGQKAGCRPAQAGRIDLGRRGQQRPVSRRWRRRCPAISAD